MQSINNKSKKDKGKKHNIQLVVASKDTAKPLDSAKEALHLIALPVQGFVVFPGLSAIGFWWHNRCAAKIRSQLAGSITLISSVH